MDANIPLLKELLKVDFEEGACDITLMLPLLMVLMRTMMMWMRMRRMRRRRTSVFKGPADNVHIHPPEAGRSRGSGGIKEPQVYN